MKVKVPGASSAQGVKAPDFTLPKGDYLFEIIKAEITESQKSPCNIHAFSMVVLDGPDTADGRSTAGRKYTHRMIQLLPEHDSYEQNKDRFASEIKDICEAAGVDIDDDGYETDDFSGQKVKAKLGLRQGKDENGEPRPENTVQTQKGEDGVVHLWLPDDGMPSKPKATSKSSSTAKRPASSRKR